VENKHKGGDRPAEEDFAVAVDAFVRKKAMGTTLDPGNNVEAAAGPEEAHTDAEERFVDTEVAANGTTVEDIEEGAAEGVGNDNQ
jgi:hypothetical protein